MDKPIRLDREAIAGGAIERLVAEAERLGLFRRMAPEEREKSRCEVLGRLPPGEDVWVFGYGSLMWNPAIHHAEARPAVLHGYHRSFSLWTPLGRGSPERPGLTLALERGGLCRGIAVRIPWAIAEDELRILWNREMISGAYVPRLVRPRADRVQLTAITFVANRQHSRYAGRLPRAAMAEAIATAEGQLGTCRDYLFSTVAHLDALGIRDGLLHDLARMVRAKLESDMVAPSHHSEALPVKE